MRFTPAAMPTAEFACNPANPFLSHLGFSGAARTNPDWEFRVAPEIRPFVAIQHIIGCHAFFSGWSEPLGQHRIVMSIAYWEGVDLFIVGLPRAYNGKPLEFRDEPTFLKAALSW
jgi:hypothetical protein